MSGERTEKLNNGIRQYIVTVIVTLVAMALIIAYTFGSFYSLAREDAITIGEKSVIEQSERLNNFLLQGLNVMQVTALSVDYMLEHDATSEQIEEFLLRESAKYTAEIDPSFTGIYGVFDGVYIDGIGWVPDVSYDPTTRPWYVTAKTNGGEPAIVSPYVDAQTGKVMISISQLLSDGESAIALDIYMDEMQRMAQTIHLSGKGYGFIIDSAGLVVAHSDSTQNGKNYLSDDDMQSTGLNSLVKQIVTGTEEAIDVELDGEKSIAFSRVVHDDWYIVMIVNHSDLFNEVSNILIYSIILAVLIVGIVSFFCLDGYRNRARSMSYADELEIYQLTLEDRVKAQTDKIREQSESMIKWQQTVVEGMAMLIESRDGNTGEHVHNTKTYVSMIVKYMYDHGIHKDEVTENFVSKVTSAAVLHDVGKIEISDVILNKPGRFTPEEYDIMKTHAPRGGDIVWRILGDNADADLRRIAYDIATHHHERWDGSGYPSGMAGEDIPLSARIMAVADVFDAMVSKRVYKEKLSVSETYSVLMSESGKHFDPEIVDVFVKLRPEVEKYVAGLE